LQQGDHIKVTASQYPFPTVCAQTQSSDWFHSIARTLKWNERQRQKSFVVIEEDNQAPAKDDYAEKPQRVEGPHIANDKNDLLEDDEDGYDIDDVSEASTPSSPRLNGNKVKTMVPKSPASATSLQSSASSLRETTDRLPSPNPRPPPLSHRHTAASRLEHHFQTAQEGESGERDYMHEPQEKRANTSIRFADRKPISPSKQQEAVESDKIARRPSQGPHRAFAVFGDDQSGSESEISESPE